MQPQQPCPAPSLPISPLAVGGYDTAAWQQALVGGNALIADVMTRAISGISSALHETASSLQQSIGQAVTSIVQPLNQVQSNVALAGAQARASVQGQTAGVTSPRGQGGPISAGYACGQFYWNLVSRKNPDGSWTAPYIQRQPSIDVGPDFCCTGTFEDYFDAINASNDSSYTPAPGSCPSPGGPVPVPTAPPPPTQQCAQWAVWVFPVGSASLCSFPYCDGSVPDPSGLGGSKQLFPDLASAQAFAASQTCVPPPGGGGGDNFYAGCGADGMPVAWLAGQAPPQGVSGQVGPFTTQAAALAAVGACTPPAGGGGGGGNGSGPTSSACPCPATGTKSDCIYIDLCDWKAFEDAIYNALCRWTKDPECQCQTKDSERWIAEDCDGTADTMVQAWQGQLGSVVTGSSVDDLVDQAAATVSGPGIAGAVEDPDPWN